EGHADSDLPRAAGDGIHHDSVEADGGDQGCQCGKETRENSDQTVLREIVVYLLFEGFDVRNCDGRAEMRDQLSYSAYRLQGIGNRADIETLRGERPV